MYYISSNLALNKKIGRGASIFTFVVQKFISYDNSTFRKMKIKRKWQHFTCAQI